ncbi:MAG: FAD-dependent oxidoreductase [Clostridiales bacterium]|jgi:NADPH-dependent 2,4-dienoyl-CoA reductase/sulfur reductase-like enzyme|nr:FAD-dependent oxidoreductase [Clostridiales bacterium]
MNNADIAVIGGGPAGMAAALSAKKLGKNVVIFEREKRLGGILNQCIHNGFGLLYFGEELTGPEYARRFADMVKKEEISVKTNTTVLSVSNDKVVTAVNDSDGVFQIKPKAVILTMGCRERTAGAIMLTGERPSGVYTAGMAQKLINTKGFAVGKKAVILGSGDIGLIMARRLTLEGAKVLAVIEIMPYSSGLKRNVVQCLDDFGIPLLCGYTITNTVGKDRLEGVFYAKVDENFKPIKETERFWECDTLLLSVGLIPELDIVADGISINPSTGSAYVDEGRMTSANGIFAAGNVLHVHDLADNVSDEGAVAGESAARYINGYSVKKRVEAAAGDGIKYVVPNYIDIGEKPCLDKAKISDSDTKGAELYFRTTYPISGGGIEVLSKQGERIFLKRYNILPPGEMQRIKIDRNHINDDIIVRAVNGTGVR